MEMGGWGTDKIRLPYFKNCQSQVIGTWRFIMSILVHI